MILASSERVALAPGQQRTLLRIERSLGKDPELSAAAHAFSCNWRGDKRVFSSGKLSPWHPFLWRVAPAALIVTLSAAVLTATWAVARSSDKSGDRGDHVSALR
jgi:hypothetical protein